MKTLPYEVMAAQVAERRETGRPLQAGDLVEDPGRGYREVVMAANAGECVEALAELEILARHSERRDIDGVWGRPTKEKCDV